MSAAYKHTRNAAGDPVWVITITGWHDIFRMAWNLVHCQVEFCEAGAKALQWMRGATGAESFDRFDQSMTGGKAKRWSIRPRESV
ncbi:MAG: hypothetical protein QM714_12575 [Nocardioides sp.]|uniref:hypothetical protein n=1 Tax=Nocardioides sp. TaxID=35761 RepID=UPI0039E32444